MSDNYYSIGNTSNQFKDLYLAGKAYLGGTNNYIYKDAYGRTTIGANGSDKVVLSGSQLTMDGKIAPSANNSFDLGTSTNAWKNFYIAGDISDGNNSVNVADLAALITYAKGQGWIS